MDKPPIKDLSSKDASLINIPRGALSDDGLHLPHPPPKLPTKIKLQSFDGKGILDHCTD